jgi:hypothetical protein
MRGVRIVSGKASPRIVIKSQMSLYPRKLVLSQDQVLEFSANLRRIAKAIAEKQPEMTVQGLVFPIRLKKLTPLKALGFMADYLEASYQEQNGAKRLALAWDAEQREPMGNRLPMQKIRATKTRLKTDTKTP